MTERPSLGGAAAQGDSLDLEGQRHFSDQLKFFGFRYGAPIHRGTPRFSRSQMLAALGARDEHLEKPENKITFDVDGDGSPITVIIDGVRSVEASHSEELIGDLFDDHRQAFVVDGLFSHPDPDDADDTGIVQVAAYGPEHGGSRPYDDDRIPHYDLDRFQRVAAIVTFESDGRPVGALVQLVPSPADEILRLPPL
jgi:hypothetical protein